MCTMLAAAVGAAGTVMQGIAANKAAKAQAAAANAQAAAAEQNAAKDASIEDIFSSVEEVSQAEDTNIF